jgi:hypothetical protein
MTEFSAHGFSTSARRKLRMASVRGERHCLLVVRYGRCGINGDQILP